jgi:hypothetical protein
MYEDTNVHIILPILDLSHLQWPLASRWLANSTGRPCWAQEILMSPFALLEQPHLRHIESYAS